MRKRFAEIGVVAWSNPFALTVVFPASSLELRQKWQLATEDGMSHVICMSGVSIAQLDEFLDDYVKELRLSLIHSAEV